MPFKTDENLPLEVAESLRSHGEDVATVFEQQLNGCPDTAVATLCRAERRTLITLDLDFADIRQYPPEDDAGIIVLRPSVQQIDHLIRLIERMIPLLGVEPLDGHLWIVDDNRVRIRP